MYLLDIISYTELDRMSIQLQFFWLFLYVLYNHYLLKTSERVAMAANYRGSFVV
jgi:hypothetical protein